MLRQIRRLGSRLAGWPELRRRVRGITYRGARRGRIVFNAVGGFLDDLNRRFRDGLQKAASVETHDGKRRFQHRFSPWWDGAGEYRGFLWLAEDVTAREEKVRGSLRQERQAALAQVVALIAHEVGNPWPRSRPCSSS